MRDSATHTPSETRSTVGRWRKRLWGLAMATTLALWLYFANDPERWPDLSLLQYLPWGVAALPTTALALLMWPLKGGWRWAAWLPTLLVLGPIMGLCTGLPDEGSVRLRLMTYNNKSFLARNTPGGVQQVALEVWEANPDILVMQDSGDVVNWRRDFPEQYRLMMGDRQVEAFGQYVIASRYPLRDCRPSYIPYGDHQHTFFHCLAEVQGRTLEVITLHFSTPRDGLNATRLEGLKGLDTWKANMGERLYQSAFVAEYLRKARHPCIVAGDFNAPQRSRVVQNLLIRGMRDVFSSASWGWGYTYGHALLKGLSFMRIDHILVSEDMGVLRAWVGGKAGSQHRPVLADVALVRD